MAVLRIRLAFVPGWIPPVRDRAADRTASALASQDLPAAVAGSRDCRMGRRRNPEPAGTPEREAGPMPLPGLQPARRGLMPAPPTATVAARQFDRCFSHPGPRITVPASGCRGAPTLHNQIRSARGINGSQGPGRGSWPVGGQVAVHPPVPALLAGARSGNGSRPRRSGPSPTGSTTRNLEDGPDHLHPHGRLGHGCSSEVPRRDP